MNPSVAVTYQLDKNSEGDGVSGVTTPTKPAEPKEKKGWFLIRYADFCYGDKGGDGIGSLADAKKKVLGKPRTSSDAY